MKKPYKWYLKLVLYASSPFVIIGSVSAFKYQDIETLGLVGMIVIIIFIISLIYYFTQYDDNKNIVKR